MLCYMHNVMLNDLAFSLSSLEPKTLPESYALKNPHLQYRVVVSRTNTFGRERTESPIIVTGK